MNAEKNLVNLMKYMFSKRIISARDGNVSFKPKNERYFLISPSSVRKNDLHQNQILKIDFDDKGELTYDNKKGKPSRELYMHSLLLTSNKFFDKDTFVIHAHPPNVISYMGFDRTREINKRIRSFHTNNFLFEYYLFHYYGLNHVYLHLLMDCLNTFLQRSDWELIFQ